MKNLISSLIFITVLSTACTGNKTATSETIPPSSEQKLINELTASEKEAGWTLLFDGQTTQGWRGAHMETFPEYGWKIENGELIVLQSDGGESTNGGDIVTDGVYSAFELSVDFKITPGANSGIKYFVTEEEKQKGSAYGLEFQILDDSSHPDANLYTTFPGSRKLAGLYDLIAPENVHFNGIGEWNTAVVKVFPDNRVEHWLNGKKTVSYVRGSAEYKEKVKGSKYADASYNEVRPFGEAPAGRILLQDHGDEVAFRNIKIRELK